MLSNLLNKIKDYALEAGAVVIGLLSLLFLYEKRKANVNEALADKAEEDTAMAKSDAIIDSDDTKLQAEEQKRQELLKEKSNEASTDDIVKLLNDRNKLP